MASTNFLSKESFKLLKHFSKVTSIAPPESNTLPEDCLDQLVSSAFVTRSVSTIDVDTMASEFSYAITEDGKGYLRYLKKRITQKMDSLHYYNHHFCFSPYEVLRARH